MTTIPDDGASDPLVSVIVPTHNSARFVEETLDSISRQTYQRLEVLVTDDGSTDGTGDLLRQWAKADSRIRVAHHPEALGPAHARNNSIERARGHILAFCDADDVWEAEKLERQLAFMARLRCQFSFTATTIIDETGRPTGRRVDMDAPDSVGYRDMLRKAAVLSCSTVMLHRSVAPDLRMPPLYRGQDYATWLALLRDGGLRAHCLREPLTLYRITPGSVSRNKFKKALGQWSIYRDVEHLPLTESAISFFFYAFRALMR